MLKYLGMVLGVLTVVWMVLEGEALAWASVCSGAALAAAIFTLLTLFKKEPSAPPPVHREETDPKAAQMIDNLSREIQKAQQKGVRAEERCLSYQKLVEVHQQEIERLRQESQTMAQELIQKERKLSELHLSKMEPDLFDSQRHQLETVNRELKKQLLETKSHLSSKKRKKLMMEELESRDLLS